LAPLPDGSRSASIARPDGPFLARLWKPDGARVAAVFVGPSDYHPVFAHLGKHLMQLGIASLVVAANPPAAEPSLRAAGSLLWLRGVGRPVLAGAGPCAMSALACARQLDAEAVALFSSFRVERPRALRVPRAAATLREVASDLAAACVPRLAHALGHPLEPAKPHAAAPRADSRIL